MNARRGLCAASLLLLLCVPWLAWAVTKADCARTDESCTAGCRALADPRLRAACWPACMTAYAGCLALAQ